MTGTSARNSYGIFKNKMAKALAIKYNLEIYDKNSYIHDHKLIFYSDVKFIVDNLWLDHFMYNSPKPLDLPHDEYNDIFNELMDNFPHILNPLFN